MASESETEEFYDAEDKAENDSKSKLHLPRESSKARTVGENQSKSWEQPNIPMSSNEEIKEAERIAKENEQRRRKVEERRRKMLTDEDDDIEPSSGQSSKNSSIDGIFLGLYDRKVPYKKESNSEVNSIISLGKVGTLLGSPDTVSLDSRESLPVIDAEKMILAEPDLVASTKGDRTNVNLNEAAPPPVAPPRRNRKGQKLPQHSLSLESKQLLLEPPPLQGLPSSTSAMESIVQELEYSLDLKSAIRGHFVVKPQDHEQDRAPIIKPKVTDPTDLRLDLKVPNHSDLQVPNPSTLSFGKPLPFVSGSGSLEEELAQMNLMMRTRSDSGRPLTDMEILEQVMVTNLDTGEKIPLSKAEDQLPRGINPLSLHLMRLTSEYISNSSLEKDKDSDEESVIDAQSTSHLASAMSALKKKAKFKDMIGRTVEKIKKIKSAADEVYHSKHGEDLDSSDDEILLDSKPVLKVKGAHGHKGPYDFENVREVQDLSNEHSKAIWTMKFSSCGRLLATAGQDHILRIWVLRSSFTYFDDMRQKYNTEVKVSPTPSQESLISQVSAEDPNRMVSDSEQTEDNKGPFMSKPFCSYQGHTADLLDVSWSKNYFILSSSMDKTVRLWHISRKECLCCFQHIDFVTAIAFHPRDDRYFLSGSLDGKLRLWNIPDKKVAMWNELDGHTKLITSASFCQNGKFAVIGSYDGRCIFYNTEQLKYYTQIHVRSTRGKNKQGRKISGIESMPGEDKILVTSNDSRIRLYDLRDLSLSCKYKGYVNLSSQIRASYSHDGKYIISGSENQFIYIWKTHYDYSKFSSARKDRNGYWEGIKAHSAVVTAAVFAPNPGLILAELDQTELQLGAQHQSTSSSNNDGYVFVSADFSGTIKVFAKRNKPRSTTLP